MMTEHNIRIMCPNMICRKVMTVPISARGKMVQCPQCRKRLRIPQSMASTRDTHVEPEPEAPAKKKAG